MSTDHPHPLRLDGQGRLGRLLLWDDHHRAQVDYASTVGRAERRKITKQDFPSTPDPLSTSFVQVPREQTTPGHETDCRNIFELQF